MKHIVYKFGGDEADEMDFDAHSLLTFTKGDILSRRGITWKVDAVEKEENIGIAQIPTYWIYLSLVVVN